MTGPDIRLRVIDTGIGMDAATQALIFDPFFTTKDTSQSSGLGLSTVYGIVQQLGGDITVDSAPGRGTTFDVRLPRLGGDDDGDTDDRHLGDDGDEPLPAATGHGEVLLLVEDLDMLRDALAVLLTALGYQVRAAATPAAALEMVDAGLVPAIVISDLMLPGMSGVELVDRLEARLPGLHVLFMSGNPRDALDARRRRGQSTAFLPKPFAAADLTRELDKMRKPPG